MTELPELNTDLISRLIRWAENDAAFDIALQQWVTEHHLGEWDQEIWGAAELTEDAKVSTYEIDQDVVDLDVYEGLCQTSHCMAGGAVAASGYRLVYSVNEGTQERYIGDVNREVVVASECQRGTWAKDGLGRHRFTPEGPIEEVQNVAAVLLGFDEYEAGQFFYAGNSIERLKQLVNMACRRRSLGILYPAYDTADDDETATEDVPF